MAHRRSGTNGFVRALRILLLFECVRGLGQVGWTVFRADVFAHFLNRLGRDAGGIGTHVGDQADHAFFAEFHAFIQALGDHHGALYAETQLAGRILLQLAGGEGRRGVAAAFFFVDGANYPVGFFQRSANLLGVFAVGDFNLLFALAHEAGVEGGRLGESRVDGPIFDFLERLDLAFAFDDQAQSYGLHAARGKSAANFIPEQRGDLISHEPVKHAASLLRVHQVLIDGAGMFERGLHGALGNFVEGDALNARRRRLLTFL
jgi:hypothetical protein